MEYSVLWDSCFCFPCGIYDLKNKKNLFTSGGYINWKQALAIEKGFDADNRSKPHELAYSSRLDIGKREKSGRQIENSWTNLSNDHLKWLNAVFLVTNFSHLMVYPFVVITSV